MAQLSPEQIRDAKEQGKIAKQAGLTQQQMLNSMSSQTQEYKNYAISSYSSSQSSQQQGQASRDLSLNTALTASASGKSNFSEMTEKFVRPSELLNKKTLGEEILKQIERESQLHTDINERMGITGELSRSYRDSIIETVPHAVRLGFDIKNLTDLTVKLGETSGRFNLISQDTMEKTVVTTRAFGTTMGDMAVTMSEFEKVGLGQADTLAKINNAGKTSLTLGLNSKTVLKDIQTNLSNLNQYGFSKGVEGLSRMAQKAVEFRMNMSETFKLADKVMNPESAIELTANMQMLGGAIGDLNDPLKLMYMATNNVEGLQDALHGAASGLATYNKEQGRFEIVGANLRKAQEMAKTLGVDYKEFAKGAIAANERIAAGEILAARGLNIDDKDKEFLTNMSQMKGGEMQITIPQSLMDKFGTDFNNKTEVKLSNLTQTQLGILKQNRDELEKMNPENIAKAQFTSAKNAENYLASIAAEVVKGGKNTIVGRNEYTGDKEKQRGIVNLETINKIRGEVVDNTSKQVLLGFDNTLTSLINLVVTGVSQTFKAVTDRVTGGSNDPKSMRSTIEDYYKTLYKTAGGDQNKLEEENKRLKEWYDKGTGKDQSITSTNLNLKITHVGLGDGYVSNVSETGKGYLKPYV